MPLRPVNYPSIFIQKRVFLLFFVLWSVLGWTQNTLEKASFATLTKYIDNHESTDTLYFDYLKAYLNKVQKAGDLSKVAYIESKYVVHSKTFEERLQHAQAFLKRAKQQNHQRYIGLAYNELALVYHIERNWEQSLHYELLAEAALAETDDLYSLNKSRYGIGSIYYFLGEYEKALRIFKQTTAYYESRKSYNDLNGYINSVQFQIKCLYQLGNYKEGDVLLALSYQLTNDLKPYDKELNNAYLSLLKGQSLYAQKQYNGALPLLQKAVAPIKANGDFANEHLAYLYIGKNLWATGKREEAVGYFKKIDTLYDEKTYSDLNMPEAYSYLIAYYKDAGNIAQQLFYTEKILAVSNHLQQQYKGLSKVLHTRYETSKLEASRIALKKELQAQTYRKYLILGGAAVVVVILVVWLFYYNKKQKELRQKYETFTQQRLFAALGNTHIVVAESTKKRQRKGMALYDTDQAKPKGVPEKTVQSILERLALFEAEKGYLQPKITTHSLAKDLGTNNKYLSEVINTYKGTTVTNYLNNLRIDDAVAQLHEDATMRKFTVPALAEAFGFNNTRSFSDAFEKVTDMKPMSYISQIKKAQRNN